MAIKTVKLSELVPSKANPRTVMDAAALEGLAASIKTDGLLQNLVVRKKGKKYEIISGERRYRALKLLEKRGDIDGGYLVPVDVRGVDADDALRLATVENIQREALPPMDEAEAFVRMAADGADLADIAAKAGVSEATVKRRLALAALCDEAKEAVRSGSISLSVAEALTLGTADEQRAALMDDGYELSAEEVRRWLVSEKLSVTAAMFPLEKYTGTLTRDLFCSEEETFFDDMEQFHRLQHEAVAHTAKLLAQDGAQFVDTITEYHAPWWQYREAKPGEIWGAVIHHAPSGRVEVRHGLTRIPISSSVKEATSTPKVRAEYPTGLRRYMAAQKSLAVQAALLENPRKAKEVAVLQMLGVGDYQGSRVKVQPHFCGSAFAEAEAKPKAHEDIVAATERLLALLPNDNESRLTLAEQIRYGRRTPVAIYEAVKRLTDGELEGLHLLLTTLCFGQGNIDALDTKADSLFNLVAADLQVNMADYWRPDEVFLSKRTLDQLKGIARDSGALPHLGVLKDYKKKGLVAALARYFSQVETPQAANWLPDAMLFPAVGEGAAEAEQEEVEDDDECEEEEMEDAA